MRVLFIAGYTHPAYHRKIELLADAPDVEILHVTVAGYGRESGRYASASGVRSYQVQTFPAHYLGHDGDPHRSYLWPPHFAMRRFRPHIVHAESDVETLGTAQVAMARLALARRSPLVLYSWQNILRRRKLPVRLLAKFNMAAADHIVCSSQEADDVLRRQGFGAQSSIMPLVGVDTRYFFPHPVPALRHTLGLSGPEGGLVIGFGGRLVAEKGVDTLLHAFAHIDVQSRLVLIGDGPEADRLRALAHTLGVADRLSIVGSVSYDEVGEYMNALDILVLPSRTLPHWKEQFGRVLVEAMGCRIAVVGSDSGAIPEVIGNPAMIFPEGDALALARILSRLIAEPEFRHATAEQGFQRVQTHFTVERITQKLLSVWRDLVRSSTPLD